MLGDLLAGIHRHAWRPAAPAVQLEPQDLAALLHVLIRSGSVGLIWPRLGHRYDTFGAIEQALEAGYKSQREHNRRIEVDVETVVSRFRAHGIEPVLFKGIAVSKLYPNPLVRPAGDIDLWVSASDFAEASRILDGIRNEGASIDVDLHKDAHWKDPMPLDFHSGSRLMMLGGAEVAVPSAESHLRLLCLHFLRHAASRPLRLCDIALVLETRPDDFDWELFLGTDRRRSGWISTTLGLAHHLIGADIENTPFADEAKNLPEWLVPAVLRNWALSERQHQTTVFSEAVSNPKAIVDVIQRRWPDPVSATVRCQAPFNEWHRFPLQVAAVAGYAAFRLIPQAVSHLRAKRFGNR